MGKLDILFQLTDYSTVFGKKTSVALGYTCRSDSYFLANHNPRAELEHVEDLLKRFMVYTEEYYTKAAMTYNVHQLIHWVTSLANWGPSYAHTAYPFETANGNLLRMIKVAKGVTHQVCRSLSMRKCDTILRNRLFPQVSARIKELYRYFTGQNILKKCEN